VKDIEILQALLNGNHLEKAELMRAEELLIQCQLNLKHRVK
jgi:hypothetical protein